MAKNQYRKLIDLALAMPKYEPPKYKPVKRPSFKERVKDLLTTQLTRKVDAQLVYDIMLHAGVTGHTTIADAIPVHMLHRRMALETNRFVAEAIMRGGLPMTVHILDRFEAVIDFGHGRCLHLYTQLHQQADSQSLASFIVEESRQFPKEIEITDALIRLED